MNEIITTAEEIRDLIKLCLKQGLINDIDLSEDIIKEFNNQYSDNGGQHWDFMRLTSCILRAGYTLGQRAERARKNNKGVNNK